MVAGELKLNVTLLVVFVGGNAVTPVPNESPGAVVDVGAVAVSRFAPEAGAEVLDKNENPDVEVVVGALIVLAVGKPPNVGA